MPNHQWSCCHSIFRLFVLAIAVIGVSGACMDDGVIRSTLDLELTDPTDAAGGTDNDGATTDAGGGDGGGENENAGDESSVAADGDAAIEVTTPDNDYCAQVDSWDPQWTQFEQDVIELVNERRAEGAVCGDTTFGPAEPLVLNGALRCAARHHAMDMAVRGFFDHTNPDGDGPGQRIDFAEYDHRGWGENIAFGHPSPQAVMDGWMDSPGHCSNIMKASFNEIGVGYHDGNQWVQVFGTSP